MDCHEYTLDIDDICLHSEQCDAKPSTQIQYELTLDGIVVGKGTLGFKGNGIKNVSYIPSTEDEGENVVTVLTDDGQTFTFNVRNGSRGNGISSIDVEQSDVDAGASKLTVNFTDGDSKEFLVYNGHTGQAAGFGTPTISIDDTYGTPEASVTATGPDTAKVFHFDLKHLKGNGIESVDFFQSSVDGGTNTIVFNLSDGTKKTVQILNGSKGGKGDAGDKGTSVSKVEQTVKSTADSGTNVLKITLDDGTSSEFEVRNGHTGQAAGFGKPSVSIEGGYGTPTATVEASGPDTAKVFSFKLSNLKGNGIEFADYIQSTQDDGSNRLTFTFSDGTTKEVAIKNGSKGSKGDTGAPFSISKVYESIAAMNAGYATDGVPIGGFVVIDTGDVEDPDNAKLFVKNSTEYGYITDMSGSKGIQGPKGVGVSSVEQTVTSTEDGGENSIVVKLDNGEEFPFAVRNGRKGSTGSAAGFGTPTATVDGNEGTPSVTVAATGPDTAKVFSFEFKNLKGHTPTHAEMDALVDANGTVVDTKAGLDSHIASKANPHEVTKAQIGLGNVDDTSDMDKPVSTAMQEALVGKANSSDIETAFTFTEEQISALWTNAGGQA